MPVTISGKAISSDLGYTPRLHVTEKKTSFFISSDENFTLLHDIWLHFVTKVRLHAEKLFHKRRCGKVFWHVIERTNLANFCAIAMTFCQ